MSMRAFYSRFTLSTLAPFPSGVWRPTPGPPTTVTAAVSTERVQLIWLPPGVVLQAIAVYATNTAASTDLRFGIRADNNTQPGPVLLDAGLVAADATGVRSRAISFTVPSTPVPSVGGVPLWLSVTPQGLNSVALLANHVISEIRDAASASTALLYKGCATQAGVTGALPTSFAASGTASPAPLFAVQAA